MPEKMHRMVKHLQAKGYSERSAWRIANAAQTKHERTKRREKRMH